MSAPSPLARSLAWLRKQGWTCDVVERRLPFCRITKDAFGVIDAIGLMPGRVAGFQVTSRSNAAARRRKALESPGLVSWLQAGALFYVVSVAKGGAKGRRKTWNVAVEELTLADVTLHQQERAARETVAAGESTEGQADALAGHL